MDREDLAHLVRDALVYAGGVDEKYLEVRVGNDVVTLGGIAFSDAQRQEAEDVARRLPGVRRVVNEILVVRGPRM